jgi:lipid A ethanolaminephosphotransferase
MKNMINNWKNREYGLTAVVMSCAVFMVIFDNLNFWRTLFEVKKNSSLSDAGFCILVFIALTAFFNFILSFFAVKYVVKPVLILILLTASVTAYFMDTYRTVIDNGMIQNVFQTNKKEVAELVSLRLFFYLIFFGVCPSILIGFVRIKYKPFLKEFLLKAAAIFISFCIVGGVVFLNYKNISMTVRQHQDLRYFVNPEYPIYALFKYIKQNSYKKIVVKSIGDDAKQALTVKKEGKKSLVILVVGEAARANNFSLNGYPRDTNKFTKTQDIVFFNNVYSCGTSTAVSVPCMFSLLTRENFSDKKALSQENLLDVLKHAGVNVLWRDNNSGCKGVCNRVEYEDMSNKKSPEFCNSDECFDEILLSGLQEYLDKIQNDGLVVLHQKGSHGPAYYKRYPESFAIFKPECKQAEVKSCNKEEIVNAYDNTILYTDYFLSRVIVFLQKQSKKFNTVLFYVSDHGQSLGENGIYLHGLPYYFAPEDQKHIPMILWLSDGYKKAYKIDERCLKGNSNARYTHDNVSHSIFGFFNIETSVYEPQYDIFSVCKNKNN